ncbi:MAG: hypothetical protein ACRC67_33240 [Inquilinus sp.]|uniref:hypothetical protein n=1 Tax=Inquilinus sp. TaxID=1932117 RepID=UPI003F2F6637
MHVLTLADIHRRFDGPIPRAEIEAAEREAPGTRVVRTIARTTGQPTMKPHVVLGRMAGAIVDLAGETGEVTERALLQRGFTADQLRAHFDTAMQMAAPKLPADRQVA